MIFCQHLKRKIWIGSDFLQISNGVLTLRLSDCVQPAHALFTLHDAKDVVHAVRLPIEFSAAASTCNHTLLHGLGMRLPLCLCLWLSLSLFVEDVATLSASLGTTTRTRLFLVFLVTGGIFHAKLRKELRTQSRLTKTKTVHLLLWNIEARHRVDVQTAISE